MDEPQQQPVDQRNPLVILQDQINHLEHQVDQVQQQQQQNQVPQLLHQQLVLEPGRPSSGQ